MLSRCFHLETPATCNLKKWNRAMAIKIKRHYGRAFSFSYRQSFIELFFIHIGIHNVWLTDTTECRNIQSVILNFYIESNIHQDTDSHSSYHYLESYFWIYVYITWTIKKNTHLMGFSQIQHSNIFSKKRKFKTKVILLLRHNSTNKCFFFFPKGAIFHKLDWAFFSHYIYSSSYLAR